MANQNVIVWEFEGDLPGLFSPFGCKISNWIEEQYEKKPTDQNIHLGDIDHLLGSYEIDFVQMVQKNLEAKRKERKVRRQKYSTSTVIGSGIIWQWMTEQGWVVYDVEAIEAIERCFNQNKEECDLGTLQHRLPNVVLLKKEYQRNKSTGFVRPVGRTTVNYKLDGAVAVVRRSLNNVEPVSNAAAAPNVNVSRGARKRVDLVSNAGAAPSNGTAVYTRNTRRRMEPGQLPPTHILHDFSVIASSRPGKEDGEKDCAICLSSLHEDQPAKGMVPEKVLELKICKHQFHESCLEALYKQSHNQSKCLRCPICKQIHGTLKGDQPQGRMHYRIDPSQSVEGYEGDGMIVITYDIFPGVQGPEHPNPGRNYHPAAFPRVAYLPANKKGRMCLQLLEVAFNRRLTFTVGTSSTSGADDCVTWTSLHHKTSSHGNSNGHGFPDPGYMDNLLEELKNLGVTKDDLKF